MKTFPAQKGFSLDFQNLLRLLGLLSESWEQSFSLVPVQNRSLFVVLKCLGNSAFLTDDVVDCFILPSQGEFFIRHIYAIIFDDFHNHGLSSQTEK